MIYLASPYSGNMRYNTEASAAVAAAFMEQGEEIYSPVAHGHVISKFRAFSWERWMSHCLDMLSRCDEMYVLQIPGWDTSEGVQREIDFCTEHDIPVHYIEAYT